MSVVQCVRSCAPSSVVRRIRRSDQAVESLPMATNVSPASGRLLKRVRATKRLVRPAARRLFQGLRTTSWRGSYKKPSGSCCRQGECIHGELTCDSNPHPFCNPLCSYYVDYSWYRWTGLYMRGPCPEGGYEQPLFSFARCSKSPAPIHDATQRAVAVFEVLRLNFMCAHPRPPRTTVPLTFAP